MCRGCCPGEGELLQKVLVRLAEVEHQRQLSLRLHAEARLRQQPGQHGGAVLNGGKLHSVGGSCGSAEQPPEREDEILRRDGGGGGAALGGGVGQAAF